MLAASLAVSLAISGAAPANDVLRAETDDWILTAPAVLVTQSDLELVGRSVQLCTNEIELLTGHKPRLPVKFTMNWVVDGLQGSGAIPTGVLNHVPSDAFRIIDDVTRPFWQERVARGVCFGPHEVTHVLTFHSRMPAWAFEGLATFTDALYESARWQCCASPPALSLSCDETGYTDGQERHEYSDLSPFKVDFDSYRTAACLWHEAYRLRGLPAIRGILASMRARPASTAGELVVHHFSRVLNVDFRPVVARYGFTPAELTALPTSRIHGCTLIGTAVSEGIAGTPGADTMCGLAGNDRLTGGGGNDVLEGGAGSDTVRARDGLRDIVRGGPGRDTARIDRGLDRVTGVEIILH